MKNYNETITSLISDLSCETHELIEYPRDLNEASHEHADGHEAVIYWAKAHELIRSANMEETAEAESRFEEMGGLGDDLTNAYNRTAQLLAYHIVEGRFQELVRGELETLKEELETLHAPITLTHNWDNAIGAKLEAISSILG